MPITPTDWIWMNGTFVPWKEANVHVMSHALHYGSSVFEGLRAYKTANGTAVFALDGHLDRLWNSCKVYRMQIPYERPALKGAILQTVVRNELESAYIRPIVYRGFGEISLDARKAPVEVAIITFPFGRYLGAEAIEQGIDVGGEYSRPFLYNHYVRARRLVCRAAWVPAVGGSRIHLTGRTNADAGALPQRL